MGGGTREDKLKDITIEKEKLILIFSIKYIEDETRSVYIYKYPEPYKEDTFFYILAKKPLHLNITTNLNLYDIESSTYTYYKYVKNLNIKYSETQTGSIIKSKIIIESVNINESKIGSIYDFEYNFELIYNERVVYDSINLYLNLDFKNESNSKVVSEIKKCILKTDKKGGVFNFTKRWNFLTKSSQATYKDFKNKFKRNSNFQEIRLFLLNINNNNNAYFLQLLNLDPKCSLDLCKLIKEDIMDIYFN